MAPPIKFVLFAKPAVTGTVGTSRISGSLPLMRGPRVVAVSAGGVLVCASVGVVACVHICTCSGEAAKQGQCLAWCICFVLGLI